MIYTEAYFERPTREREFAERGELREDQLAAIEYLPDLGRVLSIGAGRGLLERKLSELGAEVTSLDLADFRIDKGHRFITGNLDAVPDEDFDAVVMCEVIEHIDEDEFERNWPRMVAILKRTHGRFVVTNWKEFHPIPKNGWDHVREINDSVYDRLERDAVKTLVREGSHLVLQF